MGCLYLRLTNRDENDILKTLLLITLFLILRKGAGAWQNGKRESPKAFFYAQKKEFLEKGYKDASLREIAEKAGTSTGAIYIRYPDKGALFSALVEPVAEGLMGRFRAAQDEHFDLIPAGRTETRPKRFPRPTSTAFSTISMKISTRSSF